MGVFGNGEAEGQAFGLRESEADSAWEWGR